MQQIISIALILLFVNGRLYTSYKQCDSNWGSDKLGTGSSSICSNGSLISSIAMIFNTQGITTDGVTTPRTMNSWLKRNNGYASGDLFIWSSIQDFGFIYQGKFSASQAKLKFDRGDHVILGVNEGSHYVLMTSYSGDTFNVNDPGYSKTSYPQTAISYAPIYTYSKLSYFKNHILKLE
ncbi:unnamed protein product (macronuclear) [Paramecium tetraurelia]|uniref:Peptidase C39-like domain-containing protein n=1 Tax=Paramecium tetraurelia TaxID=5888 RepID=A0CUF7_PARTE|nr:uncharacterized protein GSPATT00010624001 [Paramecium tetraurelia]CAK74424.1 unnamed protein product [Paramecium tetraurelia]|eukprot:XP_001441821.1 hypothetical protein (macronuclear) [Paramecium tetraurelia strain d4-2]